jgi:hypothetical protein
MWWMWFASPLAAGLLYVLTGQRDKRRDGELERWQKQMGRPAKREVRREDAAYRSGKEVTTTVAKARPGPRRVTSMPGPLTRILDATGGGTRIDAFELVPKLAYLVAMAADAIQGSDHTTVVARLDEAAPTFTVRPLPVVEGERIANTGVAFKKDPEFMELFLVDRDLESNPLAPADEALDKAIRKWLSPPLREALIDLPESWLRVDGKAKVMALTLYGPADAARLQELVAAADIVFAEYGADGGPSLLGDDEQEEAEAEAAPPPPPSKKKAKPAGTKPAASSG